MKAPVLCFVLGWLVSTSQAAPESPIEGLFLRAETVWLARVASVSGGSVTIQCEKLLRGKDAGEMTLTVDRLNGLGGWRPTVLLKVGSEFLLLSQGDEKKGPPLPVIGHSFEGQFGYRGWTPFPIERRHQKIYVEGTLSFVDRRFPNDLPLAYVKRLLEQFPYGSAPR